MPSEEDEEDERTAVAPNTGAGRSHPQATTDPEEGREGGRRRGRRAAVRRREAKARQESGH